MNLLKQKVDINYELKNKSKVLHEMIAEDFLSIKKILINEDEVSNIFGFGYSLENLKLMREKGTHRLEFIQLGKGSRVLYSSLSIYEELSGITIATKVDWIVKRIRNIINKKVYFINQNELSKLLGVSPGTISNYTNNEKLNFISKRDDGLFSIIETAEWILKNSIKCV